MAAQQQAFQVRITGRVQGVGFRDWTAREARLLGLAGWVRNERDGSVTALFVGPEDAVAAMIERLWKGPRLASVSDVTSQVASIAEMPAGFRITD
ncbi:acylphosphatase [Rhizobium sp. TH2]|uniref:acylphosphatase n=1 Tax=Rhizobium sp. TH2 TaxID=2775403 RepID=UPI002157A794|nr:acylphosphatase [Rhizobium sp. TH2]UVC11587.1 acylphosphatase [Rhizobium sp. TH2]